MTTAIERFKMLLANTLERVCILEEQLELAQGRIQELEEEVKDGGTEAASREASGEN